MRESAHLFSKIILFTPIRNPMPVAKKKRAYFKLRAPEAREVSIAGTFNNWDSSTWALKRDKKGTWKTWFDLPAGQHEYCFVVDGEWQEIQNLGENNIWNNAPAIGLLQTGNSTAEIANGFTQMIISEPQSNPFTEKTMVKGIKSGFRRIGKSLKKTNRDAWHRVFNDKKK